MKTILNKTAWLALFLGFATISLQQETAVGGEWGFRPYYYPSYGPPIIVSVPKPGLAPLTGVGSPIGTGGVNGGVSVNNGASVNNGVGATKSAGSMTLLDVRIVDPGDPKRKLGPRLRVFFANQGAAASKSFDMVLAAGISRKFDPNFPQTMERVSAMQPGQKLAVDVRLPMDCMAMNYPGETKPAPFSFLFLLIAGQKDLLGNAGLKQLAAVPRISIQMVDLDPLKVANASAPAGAVITLVGEGFGFEPGTVVLSLSNLNLQAEIVNWGPLGIQVKLPELALAAEIEGTLKILRNDGMTAQMQLKVLPPNKNGALPQNASQTSLPPKK